MDKDLGCGDKVLTHLCENFCSSIFIWRVLIFKSQSKHHLPCANRNFCDCWSRLFNSFVCTFIPGKDAKIICQLVCNNTYGLWNGSGRGHNQFRMGFLNLPWKWHNTSDAIFCLDQVQFHVPSHSPVPGMWCYIKVTFLHFHVGSSLWFYLLNPAPPPLGEIMFRNIS